MRYLTLSVVVVLVLVACAEGTEGSGTEPTVEASPVVEGSTGESDLSDEPEVDTVVDEKAVEEEETVAPVERDTAPRTEDEKLPEPVPPPTGVAVTGEVAEDVMANITTDLYARTGATASEVVLVRAEQAIWNDGSLGCALPGESYTQALVDGFWVVFEYAGTTYDYRASASGFFKLCEGGGQPPSNPTG